MIGNARSAADQSAACGIAIRACRSRCAAWVRLVLRYSPRYSSTALCKKAVNISRCLASSWRNRDTDVSLATPDLRVWEDRKRQPRRAAAASIQVYSFRRCREMAGVSRPAAWFWVCRLQSSGGRKPCNTASGRNRGGCGSSLTAASSGSLFDDLQNPAFSTEQSRGSRIPTAPGVRGGERLDTGHIERQATDCTFKKHAIGIELTRGSSAHTKRVPIASTAFKNAGRFQDVPGSAEPVDDPPVRQAKLRPGNARTFLAKYEGA